MKSLSKDPSARQTSCDQLGIELAEGATLAWGPGWLNARSGVAVMAAGEMVAVTRTHDGWRTGHASRRSRAEHDRADARRSRGAGAADDLPSAVPAPAPVDTPAPAPVVPPAAPVRPSIAVHAVGSAVDVVEDDIVPVKEIIITPPGSPAPMLLAALVLIALVIGAAFAGIGAPSHDKAGTGVLVNGKDPGASTLSVDLSEPLKPRWRRRRL